ncbi:MAG: porin [Cohaesibacteraceae bacterium]|nr:porin [Cohaesibacteraceae bacterium]
MTFKSMILGSAAAIMAVSSVQAADLPVAEPVDYVRVCDFDGWGTGIQIPGTETCLKIGGYVRTQIDYVETSSRADDAIAFSGKGLLKFDAINDTEYGALRSYIEFSATNGAAMSLGKAYIQFNGFTMGYVGSFFDTTLGAGFYDGPGSDETVAAFAYTFAGGNGFSATLSLEDKNRNDATAGVSAAGTVLSHAGNGAPDVVANVNISQGWGSIKLSGAMHQLRSTNSTVDTTYGYGVGAGATFNIMSGTSVSIAGQYADGAVSYAGYGEYDAELNGTDVKKSKAWTALAALTHAWSPTVSQNFHVGYGSFDAFSNANDHTRVHVGTRVNYTGISGLYVGVGVGFYKTDYSATSTKADSEQFKARLRVQRNF